jgi:serine/threonine protein kinase
MAIEWISRPYISKVEVPESGLSDPMICKVALDWHNSFSSTLREFQCLLAVSNANPSPSSPLSRIPKLMGIVRSSVHGGIIGLLETFVPNFSENMKGGRHRRVPYGTLSSFDLTIVDISRREKWIAQIHDTIQALHRVGATWGDVKSDNVLIHSRTDDAWLIDFGGCFTEGWGDPDTAETIEGDLSMEARLADYLRLGEQYRRRLEYK